MNKPFGNVVYPVVSAALALKDRVDRGDLPDMETEQRKLIELLRAGGEVARTVDYTGDGGVFLGARYALACWIDELYIIHTGPPWADRWKERILEVEFYGTSESARRFWDQLDIALKRPNSPRPTVAPGVDALEAFFLCMTLGFRGRFLDNPAKVREYLEEMRPQIARTREWVAPRDLGVTTNVEPLLGKQALRHVVTVYGGITLAVVLLVLVLVRLVTA